MISKTSTGINFLGIPSIIMYMEHVLKIYPNHKNKIISIGSGGGYIEKLLDKFFNIDIICIDPDPLSYITEQTIYKHPLYKNVEDDDFPLNQYINDCILFINWSTPEQLNGYDIRSILKLNPLCILTTVETGFYRGSGSIGFHNFLSTNNITTTGVFNKNLDRCQEPESLDLTKYKYHSFETTCTYKRVDLPESLIYKIIIFTKEKISIDNLPTIITPYDAPENMNNNILHNKKWIPIRRRIEPLIKNLVILPED